MRGGCLLAVGARRARGSNKFSSVPLITHGPTGTASPQSPLACSSITACASTMLCDPSKGTRPTRARRPLSSSMRSVSSSLVKPWLSPTTSTIAARVLPVASPMLDPPPPPRVTAEWSSSHGGLHALQSRSELQSRSTSLRGAPSSCKTASVVASLASSVLIRDSSESPRKTAHPGVMASLRSGNAEAWSARLIAAAMLRSSGESDLHLGGEIGDHKDVRRCEKAGDMVGARTWLHLGRR